jgi:hypothetical protein
LSLEVEPLSVEFDDGEEVVEPLSVPLLLSPLLSPDFSLPADLEPAPASDVVFFA